MWFGGRGLTHHFEALGSFPVLQNKKQTKTQPNPTKPNNNSNTPPEWLKWKRLAGLCL
jgi:hypothetical protein